MYLVNVTNVVQYIILHIINVYSLETHASQFLYTFSDHSDINVFMCLKFCANDLMFC